ncbi:hypothetical protein CC78DRAFT_178990 [Lojkania enalia]|uniref:Uncharacterized protein n=1 Tax=Lojkania enalia TaxID=147567 RepID=A0A9P4K092_9PLEO|nr:hypothetical protein CC78DRAFT_178990 [Didymosphaeria enalia]
MQERTHQKRSHHIRARMRSQFSKGAMCLTTDEGLFSTIFRLHSPFLERNSSWFTEALKASNPPDHYPLWYRFKFEVTGNGFLKLVRQPTVGLRPEFHNTQGYSNATQIYIKTEDIEDEVCKITNSKDDKTLALRSVEDSVYMTFYRQLFGLFYNITLPMPIDIGLALVQSEGLVMVAIELQCLPLLRPHLSRTLAGFRQKLFLSIKRDPARWILLAMPLQDDSIFTECLVHLVGTYPAWPWPTRRTGIPSEVRQFIAHKAKELNQLCLEVDRDLLLITIENPKGDVVTPAESEDQETWILV